ncbi:hypothetical protein ACP70R_017622 [Stipagrostis hirtigluma subsp. patula]
MLPSHFSSSLQRSEFACSYDRNKIMTCIQQFVTNVYFDTCNYHVEWKKRGEKNMFCFSCALDGSAETFPLAPVCSICVAAKHKGHYVVQVRKSSYRDVVRLSDIAYFIDVAGIQVYTINGGRVVFLRSRKPTHESSKIIRGFDKNYKFSYCAQCGYVLFDSCKFCSLECKLLVRGCLSDVQYPGVALPSFRKKRRKGFPFRSSLDMQSPSNKKVKICKYVAEIKNPETKKRIWLGTFDAAEEASCAYNSAIKQSLSCEETRDPGDFNIDSKLVSPFRAGSVESQESDSSIDFCEQQRQALVYCDYPLPCPTMDLLIEMWIQSRNLL